jgi:PAS domain S-box-containing protein
MHEYLRSTGLSIQIVPVESEPAALRHLSKGEQDAAVVPLLTGAMQMREDGITHVRRVGSAIYSLELCFAVSKGNRQLLERLNTGLAILNQNGDYTRIYQKWFGEMERDEDTFLSMLHRALWVLLPLVGISLLAIGWTWFLRRQVLSRTHELGTLNRSLREKERFLQAIVDNLPVAVFGKDPRNQFVYTVWNKRCEEIFGMKSDEVLGRSDDEIESKEAAALFRETDLACVQQKCRLEIPNDFFHTRNNELVLQHTVKVPIFDEEGNPWMVLAIAEDVTLKRRTEAALLRSQANLAEAQRIAHLGSWEWDPNTKEVHWSDELYRLLEMEPHETKPSLIVALRASHPRDRKPLLAFIRRSLREKQATTMDHRMELPRRGLRHMHTTLEVRLDQEGNVVQVFGTTHDVTERRHAEEALRQAQKLEGLGVLAGGIAHDFNNLLSAILANLNLAQMTVPEDAKTAQYLKSMETTVLRAADLTRQMLAYSGRGAFVIQPLDLNQVCEEITQLLQASIPKKITIRYDFQFGLPLIEADVAQIQQVIMNLVTNASESMADQEGTLTLSTGTQTLDRSRIVRDFPSQELDPGVFVMLEVADTGCGMDAHTLEHLFEPFFTTKFSGRGLGLSALRGILRGHRAGIQIQSELGKGSAFQVFFPVGPGAIPAGTAPTSGSEEQVLPLGTILLVDDEPVVLASTRAMLEELGYHVLEARDGIEALEQFEKYASEISVVVLDLTMPRMDGHETLKELRKHRPNIRVILCSGYHEQEALRETQLGDPVGFLHKPFKLSDLRSALGKLY